MGGGLRGLRIATTTTTTISVSFSIVVIPFLRVTTVNIIHAIGISVGGNHLSPLLLLLRRSLLEGCVCCRRPTERAAPFQLRNPEVSGGIGCGWRRRMHHSRGGIATKW